MFDGVFGYFIEFEILCLGIEKISWNRIKFRIYSLLSSHKCRQWLPNQSFNEHYHSLRFRLQSKLWTDANIVHNVDCAQVKIKFEYWMPTLWQECNVSEFILLPEKNFFFLFSFNLLPSTHTHIHRKSYEQMAWCLSYLKPNLYTWFAQM